MDVDKYKKNGAYHWDWYGKRSTYTRHADFLKRWVHEKNTIEIGAGDGFITKLLGIKGVDINSNAIKLASRKGVKIDLGDPYNLPYKDGEFECALFSDSIDHFTSAVKCLLEARRVITKYLYVNIPSSNAPVELGTVHYAWKAKDFVALVESNGFKLVEDPRYKADRLRIYFKFEKKNLV